MNVTHEFQATGPSGTVRASFGAADNSVSVGVVELVVRGDGKVVAGELRWQDAEILHQQLGLAIAAARRNQELRDERRRRELKP